MLANLYVSCLACGPTVNFKRLCYKGNTSGDDIIACSVVGNVSTSSMHSLDL